MGPEAEHFGQAQQVEVVEGDVRAQAGRAAERTFQPARRNATRPSNSRIDRPPSKSMRLCWRSAFARWCRRGGPRNAGRPSAAGDAAEIDVVQHQRGGCRRWPAPAGADGQAAEKVIVPPMIGKTVASSRKRSRPSALANGRRARHRIPGRTACRLAQRSSLCTAAPPNNARRPAGRRTRSVRPGRAGSPHAGVPATCSCPSRSCRCMSIAPWSTSLQLRTSLSQLDRYALLARRHVAAVHRRPRAPVLASLAKRARLRRQCIAVAPFGCAVILPACAGTPYYVDAQAGLAWPAARHRYCWPGTRRRAVRHPEQRQRGRGAVIDRETAESFPGDRGIGGPRPDAAQQERARDAAARCRRFDLSLASNLPVLKFAVRMPSPAKRLVPTDRHAAMMLVRSGDPASRSSDPAPWFCASDACVVAASKRRAGCNGAARLERSSPRNASRSCLAAQWAAPGIAVAIAQVRRFDATRQ